MRAGLLLMLCMFTACGAPAKKAPDESPETPMRPDERALQILTVLRAAKVTVTLGDHWRREIALRGARVDRSNPREWVASGASSFVLRKFDIKATDELRISFLRDHEHIVVYARDVESLARQKGFTHRNENIASATIADEEVSVFSR